MCKFNRHMSHFTGHYVLLCFRLACCMGGCQSREGEQKLQDHQPWDIVSCSSEWPSSWQENHFKRRQFEPWSNASSSLDGKSDIQHHGMALPVPVQVDGTRISLTSMSQHISLGSIQRLVVLHIFWSRWFPVCVFFFCVMLVLHNCAQYKWAT